MRMTAGEEKLWHAANPRQTLSTPPGLLEIRSIPVSSIQLLVTSQLSECNQTALETGKNIPTSVSPGQLIFHENGTMHLSASSRCTKQKHQSQ